MLEYATYRITSPLATHRRRATCQEVDCAAWVYGWSSRFDISTASGRVRAEYVRSGSGRTFQEVREDENTIRFDFSPGQRCFASDGHTIVIRPETYLVQSNHETLRRHTRPVDWVEDLGLNQEAVKTAFERG